jgi:dTDP-4-dehydrorhamnose 3,5-epimerase
MIFKETKLSGAFIIAPDVFDDERGLFGLTWSRKEFAEHNLDSRIEECNVSFNKRRGTLRGMHFQAAPFAQAKLVRVTAGGIYDVIVDLRPESTTFKDWVGLELTAPNRLMLYVPIGLAHGFQTLEDDTEVLYQMSEIYAPETARGVRWDDPSFGIDWPSADRRIISDRDRNYPDFDDDSVRLTGTPDSAKSASYPTRKGVGVKRVKREIEDDNANQS